MAGGLRELGEKRTGSGREMQKRYLLSTFINAIEYFKKQEPKMIFDLH